VKLHWGLLAFAVSLQAAYADDAPQDLHAAALQDPRTATLLTANSATPTVQSLASPFLAAISSDEQTATVSGKFNLGNILRLPASADFLTVTAQTPVSQGSDFTNVATLDGLTGSSSVEFRVSLLEGGVEYHKEPAPEGPQRPLPIWLVTFNGKVGTQDHQYYDPTTLLQHTSHTTSWQTGASVGGILTGSHFGDGQASFNLSFDYQEFYQDGDTGESRTQCLTPDNCVTGFIGAPVLMHQGLLSGDLRWIGTIQFGKAAYEYPLGLEVKVTYDPIRNSEAVQVPIYFATDDKNALTGGVRYDWQSDSHVSTIGVFVSKAFSIGF
jgi:hypothetical protein